MWCNLNWLLMDETSLKVPLVLLSSSLHPNHQSREQRAKGGWRLMLLSRSKTLEPLLIFFSCEKEDLSYCCSGDAEKLYKMSSWPHYWEERLQPLSRGIQEQLKGDINEGSSAGDYSRSQWMKIYWKYLISFAKRILFHSRHIVWKLLKMLHFGIFHQFLSY